MEKLIYEKSNGAFPVQVHQTGRDTYRVRYGLQEWAGDYELAAHKLGEALMHLATLESPDDL